MPLSGMGNDNRRRMRGAAVPMQHEAPPVAVRGGFSWHMGVQPCACATPSGAASPYRKGLPVERSIRPSVASLETEATGRNAYLAGNIHGMTYACKVTSTQMTSVMAMLCLSAKRNRAPS